MVWFCTGVNVSFPRLFQPVKPRRPGGDVRLLVLGGVVAVSGSWSEMKNQRRSRCRGPPPESAGWLDLTGWRFLSKRSDDAPTGPPKTVGATNFSSLPCVCVLLSL